MLKLLSNENFNGDIVRGLFLRQPNLDLLRVQDVGLQEVDDPAILTWAAASDRILLTHDPEQMLSLFVVSDRMPIRQAINELLLLVNYSDQSEWKGIVLYLPL
ncbi:MAG: DUF5615 family PIN-like protein [Nostoc sp.]|uniref:DUF5615 family PIN-like protein n=1 Tax=Nostoc sp. TaxID=1180 RepID=UPI002FFBAA86